MLQAYIWFIQPAGWAKKGWLERRVLSAGLCMTVALVVALAYGPIATLLALHRDEIGNTHASKLEGWAALHQPELAYQNYEENIWLVVVALCVCASLF